METIQEEESGKKYVSVVYHHVSYQNQTDDVILQAKTGGSCQLVTDRGNYNTMDIPDYLPLAIVSLLIFLPCGVMAIYNSFKVRKSIQKCEVASAIDASTWALQHVLLAFITGPALICVMFILLYIPTH